MGAIGLGRIYHRARNVLESIHFGASGASRSATSSAPNRAASSTSSAPSSTSSTSGTRSSPSSTPSYKSSPALMSASRMSVLGPPRSPAHTVFFAASALTAVPGEITKVPLHGYFPFPLMQLQKVKEDHVYKEQMDEPAVQQLQVEVNAVKQKIQEYNTKQMALRSRAKAIDEKKEEILAKISQADFELMKHSQENSKLSSKIVQSPEKLQKNLEEKKGVRDELKTLERMAMHKVQDKNNTLEMYTKVCEKLSKHLSKIDALHEMSTAAKASEKEVKALKAKISDQSLETKTLGIKAAEWQSKVHETGDRLKAKEKERDQRIGENEQKMTALKSEVESELKRLADRERETEEKVAKAC
ncbi:hypothetical protein PVAP13_9KG013900 [Panicum virgatum]|uniref:Uncharacterized protein n=1 Tax=Panicum virgatum TaxID=38727 RepID=A0A8T0N5P6_PANVG|nr:hypothetical protein PVAP13_9KG013900 [Panicum virgatum]